MSGLPRVLPWIDWEEWLVVKNCLCSNRSAADAVFGLEIVSAWRIRGKIPHSVESTSQLLEARNQFILYFVYSLIHDDFFFQISLNDSPGPKYVVNFAGWRTETELRLQYSAAIVRAVNGLVDSSQQSYFADSGISTTLLTYLLSMRCFTGASLFDRNLRFMPFP
jgi:ribosomal biogenesis protein LAS1